MRKILLTFTGLLILATLVFAADPQVRPTITFVSKTNTKMSFTITNAAFALTDSLILIMTGDAADSNGGATGKTEFETILSDTATAYTVHNLLPNYTYRFILRSDSTGSSVKAYSVYGAGLTQLTERVNNETQWNTRSSINEKGKQIYRADSWRGTLLKYDTITLFGASDTDSTIWYNSAPYIGINGWAYGHADSTKLTIEVWVGYKGDDETVAWEVLKDSLVITSPGAFMSGNLNIPVSSFFHFKLHGNTDNKATVEADSTYVDFRLDRSSFEGGR